MDFTYLDELEADELAQLVQDEDRIIAEEREEYELRHGLAHALELEEVDNAMIDYPMDIDEKTDILD